MPPVSSADPYAPADPGHPVRPPGFVVPVQPGPPLAGPPPWPGYPPPLAGSVVFVPPTQGYPWRPPPPPVPRRRGLWLWWLTLPLALLLGAGLAVAGGLVGLVRHVDADWRTGAAAPVDAPPAQDAGSTEWTGWARQEAEGLVTAQGAALLAGDKPGYLAAADPANSALLAALRRRYDDLRAMGLGVWRQEITGGLRLIGGRNWQADLRIDYCFGEPTCTVSELVESTQWTVLDDRIVLAKLLPADAKYKGPRPWESDQLTVRTGDRVVVSATATNAGRLHDAVAFADKAAKIADGFAKWDLPPSRYVITFADRRTAKVWYGSAQPNWAAAWSVPVGPTSTEIVIRSEVVAQSDLQVLLTHEMTHVTTLAGKRDGLTDEAWWLVEGIAEYASHLGISFANYDASSATRQYVRTRWNGNPAVTPPGEDATNLEAGGKYGVAFLSVRRIAEKFGQAKMIDFFGRVVHDADTPDAAAKGALGASWTAVKADCAKYIRAQIAT